MVRAKGGAMWERGHIVGVAVGVTAGAVQTEVGAGAGGAGAALDHGFGQRKQRLIDAMQPRRYDPKTRQLQRRQLASQKVGTLRDAYTERLGLGAGMGKQE